MDKLQTYRKEINELDQQLIKLLAKRFELVKAIGELKRKHNLPIQDENREKKIVLDLEKIAKKNKINTTVIQKIWHAIFQEAYTIEK